MKEGWKYVKLGEVATIIHGKNQKEVLSENGQYPIYGSGGTNMGYATDYLCEAGTTILGRKGTINNPQFIPHKFWNVDTAFGIAANEKIDKKLLYYFVKSQDWSKKNSGTTLPSLTQTIVAETPIPLPPLPEQEEIVRYLDKAFMKIDAMKEKAEEALEEAKALFQSALTEMMTPKEGWGIKKIKDIGTVIGGTTPSTNIAEYWDGSLCWISPAELDGSHYLYDSRKKITEAAVKAKSLKLLPEGTVILSSRAPIGKVVINKVPTYCNQGFKCVVCGKEIFNEYLYWWFLGKTEYLNSLGTGATFKEISKKVVEEIEIPLPPLPEQEAIVSRLDAISERVKIMEENYSTIVEECDAMKQAMLREVFE